MAFLIQDSPYPPSPPLICSLYKLSKGRWQGFPLFIKSLISFKDRVDFGVSQCKALGFDFTAITHLCFLALYRTSWKSNWQNSHQFLLEIKMNIWLLFKRTVYIISNEPIFEEKYRHGGPYKISDRFKGCRCKLAIPPLWRVTWNYAYNNFID